MRGTNLVAESKHERASKSTSEVAYLWAWNSRWIQPQFNTTEHKIAISPFPQPPHQGCQHPMLNHPPNTLGSPENMQSQGWWEFGPFSHLLMSLSHKTHGMKQSYSVQMNQPRRSMRIPEVISDFRLPLTTFSSLTFQSCLLQEGHLSFEWLS